MKQTFESIGQQVQRNAVALISLVIAVSSLGYNTWRNETTEEQRNLRHAAFTIVEQLGELQANANQIVYFGDEGDDSAWNGGWGNVLVIQTLGQLLPGDVPQQTEKLFQVWESRIGDLVSDEPGIRRDADADVSNQIRTANKAVLGLLRTLD